jgi:HD-GYP domain-containing protein (c-di-GMP phosphodiesterase class II)
MLRTPARPEAVANGYPGHADVKVAISRLTHLPRGDSQHGVIEARQIPLSRLIGALSYALDVTEGEPPGHAVRSCKIGMRLAESLGLDADTRSDLFYALLLKDAGCSANSARMAALFGADDHVAKQTSKRVNWSRPVPALAWSVRTVAPGGSPRARVDRLLAIKSEGEVTKALMEARCERGAEIALMLGFRPATAEAIRALDEHWDGRGQPRGLRSMDIPLLARILCLAQTAEIFHRTGGVGAAWAVLDKRAGEWFDPALVDLLGTFRGDHAFWDSLDDDDLASWEPEDRVLYADEERLDRIADAFAGVVDAKSPWTYRHSDRACVIVMGLAEALGADEPLLRDLRRAALLHDIGKLAVSNRILDKPAALTAAEYAVVREHPLITERILERVPGCEHLAGLAGAHHERLDGRGYPRGLRGDELTMPMRLLAIADVYEALTSDRPYRRRHSSDSALALMRSEVPQRLDREAFATLERLLGGPPAGHAPRAAALLDAERR